MNKKPLRSRSLLTFTIYVRIQTSEKSLCFMKAQRFFVSLLVSSFFWLRWTWSDEMSVLGTDINIIQTFLKFAIDQTFFKEGKVTEIYDIIVPKESGPYTLNHKISRFLGGSFESIDPSYSGPNVGRIIFTGRCKFTRFPLWYSGHE